MSWVSEAARPFGVNIQWVAPQILEQAAIRSILIRIAAVSLLCLALFICASRGRLITSPPRMLLTAFFFPASWLLSMLALGWSWSGGGLWVWTSVALWHTALCLEWFTRAKNGRDNSRSVLAATVTTGLTVLAAFVLWQQSGQAEGYAELMGTGFFWSTAWCVTLAPSARSVTPSRT